MVNGNSSEDWGNHQWVNPREVKVAPGYSVTQRHCKRCGRDFITFVSSGERHAVFIGAISFYQLDDEVTKRWLNEPCPGVPRPEDEDRSRRIAEWRVLSLASDRR
jgi:hypothetical protein